MTSKGEVLNSFKYIWKKNKKNAKLEVAGVSKHVSNILGQRGICTQEEAKYFLSPDIANLYDPFSLHGMQDAVERILMAMNNAEKITIYGDYDVDGMTSIAVLLKYFNYVGYAVDYYIPNRLLEGYGPNTDAFKKIKDNGTSLIITVDCGISAYDEVEYANDIGLDVIVTDHHECPKILPNAIAVIDPKILSCSYPYNMLAGVGLAMKMVHAMMEEDFFDFLPQIIDIVALGTIADIAPLVDENRIIAYYGLKKMENSESLGLQYLVDICGIKGSISAGDVGYKIAPRLNAAGRLGKAYLGVELLITTSDSRAKELSEMLDLLNQDRQSTEKNILMEAEQFIIDNDILNHDILVVYGNDWHTGVIGIVASRITEKYYKPSIVLSVEGEFAVGSARSVGKFNLHTALSHFSHFFTRFGGHAQAAGLKMPVDNIQAFIKGINEYANAVITSRDKVPVIVTQSTIDGADIHHMLIQELETLEPFGVSNPKPKFHIENLEVDRIRTIGKDNTHIKMSVHNQNRLFDAIGFSMAEDFSFIQQGDRMDILASIEKNEFRGVQTIQFVISDIRAKSLYDPYVKRLYRFFILSKAISLVHIAIEESDNKPSNDKKVDDQLSKFKVIKGKDELIKFIGLANNHISEKDLYNKMLIQVEDFDSLYELCEMLHDEFEGDVLLYYTDKKYDEYYIGEYSDNSMGNEIVIFVGGISRYDILTHVYDHGIIYRSNKKIFSNVDIMMLPSRDDMVGMYKLLKSRDWKNEDIDGIMKEYPTSLIEDFATFVLSGIILDQLNIIAFDMDINTVSAKVLPRPDNKINIFNTPLFNNLKRLL